MKTFFVDLCWSRRRYDLHPFARGGSRGASVVTTDIGTLDQRSPRKSVSAKPPYSPYADRLPHPSIVLATPHAHFVFQRDAVHSLGPSLPRRMLSFLAR